MRIPIAKRLLRAARSYTVGREILKRNRRSSLRMALHAFRSNDAVVAHAIDWSELRRL